MAKFWKKQESVFSKVKTYFEKSDLTRDVFLTTVTDLVRQTPNVDHDAAVERVHVAEHAADIKRREVIAELYRKALIPGSRGDVLGLLETFDQLPNTFQKICNQILFQNVVFPDSFKERIIDLIKINIEAYNLTKDAAFCLFDEVELMNKCELICAKESESDARERGLTRDIFDSDLELAQKMLYKQIIITIGNISDLAEDVSDRVEVAVIKRRL